MRYAKLTTLWIVTLVVSFAPASISMYSQFMMHVRGQCEKQKAIVTAITSVGTIPTTIVVKKLNGEEAGRSETTTTDLDVQVGTTLIYADYAVGNPLGALISLYLLFVGACSIIGFVWVQPSLRIFFNLNRV